MGLALRHSHGFTLIELIITIALVGILAGVGTDMLTNAYKINQIVSEETMGLAESRYGIERLTRQMRTTKATADEYDISSGINTSNQHFFQFISLSSISSNTFQVICANSIVYLKKDSDLARPLIKSVSDLTIYGLDANMQTITTHEICNGSTPSSWMGTKALKIEFTRTLTTSSTPIRMVTYVGLRNS